VEAAGSNPASATNLGSGRCVPSFSLFHGTALSGARCLPLGLPIIRVHALPASGPTRCPASSYTNTLERIEPLAGLFCLPIIGQGFWPHANTLPGWNRFVGRTGIATSGNRLFVQDGPLNTSPAFFNPSLQYSIVFPMNHDPNQSCANCYNFVPKTAADLSNGFCCYNPPERVDAGIASFPTVAPTTWCGKWKGTDKTKPASTPAKT
jgi:hypothetical protein